MQLQDAQTKLLPKSPSAEEDPSATCTIQLPCHPPLTTTLTPGQLLSLFPKLEIRTVPTHIHHRAVLPYGSVTQRGLEMALRWQECEIASPGSDFSVCIDELIEVYQCLFVLSNRPNTKLMKLLSSLAFDALSEGLSLKEMQNIWALRGFTGTEAFVDAMIRGLILTVKGSLEGFRPEVTGEQVVGEGDEGFRQECEGRLETLKWVWADHELFEKLNEMDTQMEEDSRREDVFRGRDLLAHADVVRGGKRRVGMSAVRRFRRSLEKIDEEEEVCV